MTLTIDLTPQEEADLAVAARQEGLDPPAMLKRLMARFIPSSAIFGLSEEALREEYHRLANLELRNSIDEGQSHRLNQIREELDHREVSSPAVQALFQRLEEDDAKLDRLLALLEARSGAGRSLSEQ